MKVVLAETAEAKLSSIYQYLSEQAGDKIASKHVEDIENAILTRLDTFSKIGEAYQSELLRKVTIKVGM
ncbi:MAG: type II toxin-antitoxin system RelE/ParE family toxin, partial [Ostreibacterium sp.]